MKKKVVIYIPDSSSGIYLPLLWASCKSYYEIKGKRVDEYEWIHPRINYQFDDEKLKEHLLEVKPDIFGISMYIWNDVQCLEIAKWVKEQFPQCLVISGGPQQYFKHEDDWFSKYPFLDASLDGGEYGELTVADILDNLREDNTVAWSLVREVVYPSKDRKIIFKSKKTSSKLDFFWDYSPYDMQKDVILECAKEVLQFESHINGKLETTRGCPYSCAFCDWGGGIASKVIKKPVDKVKKDIDVIEAAGCSYVFLCDANFGILRDRDISIMQYIANKKKMNPDLFHLYFGGFAKSDNHTEVIKEILDLDARYNLTWDLSYKASVQSIHKDVLDNIRRSDISFEKHVYLAKYLKDNYNFSSYVECISGLPGITVDKWYTEINVFASHNMNICLYNWHLLPETPSYDKNYRKKIGMKTVNKYNNMQASNSTLRKSEVVVETFSYTKDDYKEMWIAFSIQRAFWATGLLEPVIKKILKTSNIGYGDFIKLVYRSFLRGSNAGTIFSNHMYRLDEQFAHYYDPKSSVSNLSLDFPHSSAPMASSFMLMMFYSFEGCRDYLKDWLLEEFPYLTDKEVEKELDLFITIINKFTSKFKKTRYIRYTNSVIENFKDSESSLIDYIITQMETYTKSDFLRGSSIGL
jgi:putative methyltransferase